MRAPASRRQLPARDDPAHQEREPAGAGGSSTTPAARPARTGWNRRARSALLALREVAVVIVTALGLSLLVKTFLLQAFFIPSASMRNTLIEGDRVIVSQLTPGPFDLRRGDVVVFADPGGWLPAAQEPRRSSVTKTAADVLSFVGVLPQSSDRHLVKRVIGLPGDHVVCCDADGRTTVNGTAIDETPYLHPGSLPGQVSFDTTVPEGGVWVEGDNRQDSRDSRFHTDLPGGGSVPQDLVVGRALVRVWPLDRLGWLSEHDGVFASVPAAAHR